MLPWWWFPQRMMSNSVPECEKDNLTGCVSFYTQWIDICVCIRVRGLHLVFFPGGPRIHGRDSLFPAHGCQPRVSSGLMGAMTHLANMVGSETRVCLPIEKAHGSGVPK